MLHRLFTLASVLSLILLVVTAIAWGLSYSVPWSADLGAPRHNGSTERTTDWAWHLESTKGAFAALPANSHLSWRTPYWKLALLFITLPVWLAVRRVREWQLHSGQGKCGRCGYDLRATPERCPECGTVPPKLVRSFT